MKKIFYLTLVLAVVVGLSGCGDNKTKEKIMGNTVGDSSAFQLDSSLSPQASSVATLYKIASAGAGVGAVSVSLAPGFAAAPGRQVVYRSGEGQGMGTFDSSTGEYVHTEPDGTVVRMNFLLNSQKIYMNQDVFYTEALGLLLYASQDLNGSKVGTNSLDYAALQSLSFPRYIPSMWINHGSGSPVAWHTINNITEWQNIGSALNTFIMSNFPDSISINVSGAVPGGGTMNMTMTGSMPSGTPSDANPMVMAGSGTITFGDGTVWTITANYRCGEDGPISGTQTFTSSTGESGTMTFNSDGSMDGIIYLNGTAVATMHINADGTGTFTDLETGITYSISDANLS